jgi:hypothetical protein
VLTGAAIVGGVLVSLAVNRLLASLLFGVKAADPIAVFALAIVACSAIYLPLVGPRKSIRSLLSLVTN